MMNTMKTLIACVVFAQLLTACSTQSLLNASENAIQVDPDIFLAGSLTGQAPPLIKRRNAVVIDLRRAEEGVDTEAAQMRSLGVPYFNLPVTLDTLDQGMVSQFDTLLSEHSGRPIIVHCQSGNRAGLLWAALQKSRGMTSAEANSTVSDIVTKPGVRKAIQEYTK